MSDTPDWADELAVDLLPPCFYGSMCDPRTHERVCRGYRSAVAKALREARQSGGKVEAPRPDADCLIASISGAVTQEEAFRRGYRAGIEAAAELIQPAFVVGEDLARAIRALAEKAQQEGNNAR